MKKTKRIASLICALMLFFSIAVPKQAYAFDEIPMATNVQPLSLAKQEKEDIANNKYNVLLQEWAFDKSYIDDVNANFPPFYGGAYIDDEKNLVIQVTSCHDNVIQYFGKIIDLENVEFESVKYSYETLLLKKREILKSTEESSNIRDGATVTAVGLSVKDNSVAVYIDDPTLTTFSSSQMQKLKREISSFENIVIKSVDGTPQLCAGVVEPGTEISNRSVGFWAYDSNNNLGVVTAPHDTIAEGDPVRIGTTLFGFAAEPHHDGGGSVDAVFVERTNDDFYPTRWVSGWEFNLLSNSSITLATGSTVFSKGKTTGCQYGTVQDTSFDWPSGLMTNCVLTSAICNSGDSGGIVAGGGNTATRHVAGIIVAKSSQNNGNPASMIYCKASNILSTLDISVY